MNRFGLGLCGCFFPAAAKGKHEVRDHPQTRISVERIVALTRQAEASGFEYGWIFDSHVLWKEPYPLLTLMANATQRCG